MKYPLNLLTILLFLFLSLGFRNDFYRFGIKSNPVFSDTSLVDSFYTLNHNKYIWINKEQKLNEKGDSFLEFIKNARYYGLEPEYYYYKKLKSISEQLSEINDKQKRRNIAEKLEKKLSLNYFQMGKDLNYGRVDSVKIFTRLERKKFSIDLLKYFQDAVKNDSLLKYLTDLQPKQTEYRNLQKALVKYLDKTVLSEEKIKVDPYRSDSVRSYDQARKALFLHQYISDEKISDTLFLEALRKFQYDHGLSSDGIIGKYTARALSKSTLDYYRDVAMSMERWRWKIPREKDFLYVNIPSYQLKFYINNKLHNVYRVVVGKRSKKTPEVYSKLNYLVAYPYWHVPRSISVNEILVKAKKDPEYMTRNHYEVFTKSLQPVNLKNVKWDTLNRENFNYYIRQKGGYSNALGLVKFIFKNKYSIYLHDTPTKYHFKRDIRAYSHGCIRVQNAIDLADRVLKYDENEYNKDSIEVYVKRKIEKKIELNKHLPVYIQYITCDTDADGNLIFWYDIYNRDKKLKETLFSSSK
ncbi:MAG: hypothetical protein DSY82_01225 [Flavobacteriia bacterium]|nr:MAG: hypothetical protein DSY82_01225 [Flavobacteriia bacterium]